MNSNEIARGADGLYAMGHWLLEQGKVADAASVLRTMVTIVPHDERGYLALGVCHEQTDQPEIALEIYGAGSLVSTTPARCHLARARLLRAAGDHVDALDAYEAAASSVGEDDELADMIRREREEL